MLVGTRQSQTRSLSDLALCLSRMLHSVVTEMLCVPNVANFSGAMLSSLKVH